jgi:hypothetical protein
VSGRLRFLWGVLGFAALEISRYIPIISTGKPLPHLDWLTYFSIQILSAIIGGFISIAWKTDTPMKAIWIGASWPAIVAKLVQATP